MMGWSSVPRARCTRGRFLDGACLACISHGDERSSGPEDSAARRLGIPLAALRVCLEANTPLPEDLITRATISDEERDRLRGMRVRVALGIVCGEFSLRLTSRR
jgi:hypothetical protein